MVQVRPMESCTQAAEWGWREERGSGLQVAESCKGQRQTALGSTRPVIFSRKVTPGVREAGSPEGLRKAWPTVMPSRPLACTSQGGNRAGMTLGRAFLPGCPLGSPRSFKNTDT